MRENLLGGAWVSGKDNPPPKKMHEDDAAPFLPVYRVMFGCDVQNCCIHLDVHLRKNPTCKHCRTKGDVSEVELKPWETVSLGNDKLF